MAGIRILKSLYEEVQFRLYYEPIFHRFLNHKYKYYTEVSWPVKRKFLRLVWDHYRYFEFIPREKIKLTRAMKAIICCAASQLVLGLPKQSLTFFTKIMVYPGDYYSTFTTKFHKGEVNPGFRLIVFSWKGVMQGLNRADDGLNLLLHEFAHALWLEHKLVGYQYSVLDEDAVTKFEELAEREMDGLRANEQHFFRAYAFSNIEEFFAVAVENFFERPERFKTELPKMYAALTHVFKQNPLQMKKKLSDQIKK